MEHHKHSIIGALLDLGSQSNFITEDLVRRLGLTTRSINIPIVGINQSWGHMHKK